MVLLWLIIIPVLGGFAAWCLAIWNGAWAGRVSLIALAIDAVLLLSLFAGGGNPHALANGSWLAELSLPWIPQLGIGIRLAMDGLSLVLVALTLFLGILGVACSWTEIRVRAGFFHLNLMLLLSGILGVFLALDLFVFYFFWELMLVPMYFLISIWGHENRRAAALKFFIFTQTGGLMMLLSILALYFIHGASTGLYTFDYGELRGTVLAPATSFWLMLGFLAAFLVKLPAVPLHPWLPDAHTEAPTAGSVILAGLLLKTGAYGLLRFVLPLFPEPVREITPVILVLAVISVVYGAVLSFAQTDLKRLVAYTSVSHMGFVLLGIFAWNTTAIQGAVMQMLAHGVSTGALFIIVGLLQERIHTRDMQQMGGIWTAAPRLSGFGLVFALASLGLPGFGNFVAEFQVLLGTFRMHPAAASCAAAGLVLSAIYALWLVQRTFQGEQGVTAPVPELSARETGMLTVMTVAIIWLGLFPGVPLQTTAPSVQGIKYIAPSRTRIDANAAGNVRGADPARPGREQP